MDEPIQPLQIKPARKGGAAKKAFLVLFIAALVAGALAGGYFYGKQEGGRQSQSAAPTAAEQVAATAPTSSTRYIKSIGYPFDIKDKKITINLGLPDALYGVRVRSVSNNRGAEQVFTDKFNDEMGRWVIDYPTGISTEESEISILAISPSWLKSTTATGDMYLENGTDMSTPASKKKYIADQKTKSKECAKDAMNGFATKENIFQVCYWVLTGNEAYRPMLALAGYGEIENKPFIFNGLIHLEGGKKYDREVEPQILAAAKAGKHPESINDLVKKTTTALSRTTVTVEAR